MERLQKAAIATGAAAVLLLGGAGTMAYWTDNAKATNSQTLQAGKFTLADGTCDDWHHKEGAQAAAVKIVPGDSVYTTCTFQLTATGDHMAVGGAEASDPTWVETNGLTKVLGTATVDYLKVNGTVFSNQPIPVTGSASIPVVVEVAVTFTDDGTADNSTQDLPASLQNVVVTLIQGHVGS